MTLGQILHPGATRYHTWGLIVPLLAAISPMFLSRLPLKDPQFLKALIAGLIVALVSYALMTTVPILNDEYHPSGKAVLLGLLVAEVMVFSDSPKIPSIANIVFVLFIYFYALKNLSHPPGTL